MSDLHPHDPLAISVLDAIRGGNVSGLRGLLKDHPGLATARLQNGRACGVSRTLLHVATDWPGHFPNAAATVARHPTAESLAGKEAIRELVAWLSIKGAKASG